MARLLSHVTGINHKLAASEQDRGVLWHFLYYVNNVRQCGGERGVHTFITVYEVYAEGTERSVRLRPPFSFLSYLHRLRQIYNNNPHELQHTLLHSSHSSNYDSNKPLPWHMLLFSPPEDNRINSQFQSQWEVTINYSCYHALSYFLYYFNLPLISHIHKWNPNLWTALIERL